MKSLTSNESLLLKNFQFKNSKNCCLAPYSNINFDVLGEMRVCCYNSDFTLGEYPKTSIKEAWNGVKRYAFIKALESKTFPKGCDLCCKQIIENNEDNGLFRNFDFLENQLSDYPVMMEFEFASICNYECIMCGGKWSSSIRKNREKLSPIVSPYDENFIRELQEFLPHLRYVKFLGGEPFANSIYYKIWDILISVNSNIKMSVTTNGSIFTEKIKTILNSLTRCTVTVSLDSLQPDVYKFIRKNGDLNLVIQNIDILSDMKKLEGIAFCPMIQNVEELPDIMRFCEERNLYLYINDVQGHLGGKLKGIHDNEEKNVVPWIGNNECAKQQTTAIAHKNEKLIPEVALQTLPVAELQRIYQYLKRFPYINNGKYKGIVLHANNEKYQGFLNKLNYLIQTKS